MKLVPFLISTAVTILLVFLLNVQWGQIPPIGKFLSPQHGFWQNAEPIDKNFGQDLRLPGLKDPAEVYLDDRLVPHIFASNDADAFYLQGYLHAKPMPPTQLVAWILARSGEHGDDEDVWSPTVSAEL